MKRLASLAILSAFLALPSSAGIIRFAAKKVIAPTAKTSAKVVSKTVKLGAKAIY